MALVTHGKLVMRFSAISLKHSLWYMCCVVAVFALLGQSAGALSPAQRKIFNQGINYYNVLACGTGSPSAPTGAGSGPTIVIDPGHSGTDIHDTDPQTGLYDHDYPNTPE